MTNMDRSHIQQFGASRVGVTWIRMTSVWGSHPCMWPLRQVIRALWMPWWLPKQIWPSGMAGWVNIVGQHEPAAPYLFCDCKLHNVHIFCWFHFTMLYCRKSPQLASTVWQRIRLLWCAFEPHGIRVSAWLDVLSELVTKTIAILWSLCTNIAS